MESTFLESFEKGKAQILTHWMSADLETPVSAYLKVCGHSDYSFLLESVEGGSSLGRYSIIGTSPDLIWECKKQNATLKTFDGKSLAQSDDPLSMIKTLITDSTISDIPHGLPPMCAFGLFGYLGYDMIRLAEKIPDKNPDPVNIPDSILIRPSLLVIFDNVKNMICVATPVYEHKGNATRPANEVYAQALKRLQNAVHSINHPLDRSLIDQKTKLSPHGEVTSYTTEKDYKQAVEKAIEYIRAGEIFQVVPSQRFSTPFDLPSFELYRSLRSINPSPFLFHLSFNGFSLVGSSPEILVRVRDGKVTIRPIAGTRKRGETTAEDKALAADLLSDQKECAEHLMLLDLGRNDVGRVAKIGSVKVTEQFQIELYSHVMHIVSNVEGNLRDDLDVVDALFSGFPAGTVTGAPKIRAMEIIDELEPLRRGFYAGGIGYFSTGNMDSCIALRTALVKDGKVYVQAGAGVVADSVPENEHQECCNKAKAVLTAVQQALTRSLA